MDTGGVRGRAARHCAAVAKLLSCPPSLTLILSVRPEAFEFGLIKLYFHKQHSQCSRDCATTLAIFSWGWQQTFAIPPRGGRAITYP